ncbi:uncharacterized protein UDID_19279 [Ustilago sp. UG-2017a]|nr:uncharacterized protein UDID_19279 [Ustilago sp. UG-2017a]
MLISSTPCTGFVKAASGTMIQIMARGQAIISVNGCKVQLNDVLLIPDAKVNLMSVRALVNDGVQVTFDLNNAYLRWPNGQQLVGHINPHTRHWEVHENDSEALTMIMNDNVDDLLEQFDPNHKPKTRKFSNDFIHKLYGHPSRDKTQTIEKCHGPECSGSRRAPVESMAVVQSPWRPWTPTDSHAKEERAHMRGGPAKKRTKRKEQAPPRGGPSSRSMQMVTTQGLER